MKPNESTSKLIVAMTTLLLLALSDFLFVMRLPGDWDPSFKRALYQYNPGLNGVADAHS